MKLTPGTTINAGDIVTRQTIFDLVDKAAISTVEELDLSSDTNQNVSATNTPLVPGPGTMWWDKADQVMKVWHDEIQNTAVSLWLAIGPDRFDVEALCAEPIPFGAAVQLDLTAGHKWVKLPPSGSDLVAMGHTAARMEPLNVIGFNNTGQGISPVTGASGAWISVAIAGFVWAWFPFNRNDGSIWIATGRAANDVNTLVSGTDFSTNSGGMTSPRGYDLGTGRGGVIYEQAFSATQDNSPSYCCNSVHRVRATDTFENYTRVLFFCPRMGRQSNV
jgi:hypothetical protein